MYADIIRLKDGYACRQGTAPDILKTGLISAE